MNIATQTSNLIVVTFIGSHRFRFYKDCRISEDRLRNSLLKYNIDLVTFTLRDLVSALPTFSSSFFYFFTRYGVGAWFWKPIIIQHALSLYKPKYLIYVDADCVFNANPNDILEIALNGSDFALFSQNRTLEGWISHRARRIIGLSGRQLEESTLVTAGILFVKNSPSAKRILSAWDSAMRNPRLLLHPIFNFEKCRHLHDQSVLSALVAKKMISCNLLRSGLYSLGEESNSDSINNSWICTGILTPEFHFVSAIDRISSISDYYSRKLYDIAKTLLIFPAHWLYYLIEQLVLRVAKKLKIVKLEPST